MIKNFTRDYSPITMNREWPWLWRFFFMMLLTITGTFTNGFFVSTFFISKKLKQTGNIFLACLGFTDLIITTVVVPVAILPMFSQENESTEMCKQLQIFTQWSTYSYSLFYMLVAWDFHTRLVHGWGRYRVFIEYPLGFIAALASLVSFVTARVGGLLDLDYDYCNREHFGHYWFRFITSIAFYVIPFIITIYFLIDTAYVMKNRVISCIRIKQWQHFIIDKQLTHLHLGCYLLFVVFWIPYMVLVNNFPDATDTNYYAMVWIGLVRSAITSFLYTTLNQHFRDAFNTLIKYVCCKNPIPRSFSVRHFNGVEIDFNELQEERNIHYVL